MNLKIHARINRKLATVSALAFSAQILSSDILEKGTFNRLLSVDKR